MNTVAQKSSASSSMTKANATPSISVSPAVLSTAAAVAAMTTNCNNLQTQIPNLVGTTPSNDNVSAQQQQQYIQPACSLPNKGAMTQVLPQHQQQMGTVNLPQHQLNMNQLQFLPTFQVPPTKTIKPSIFANMALRRGKWTPEEERFANGLIEEFEKGTIQDCENGSTLRAFLSRKLHCAPMRISKKYAGKSIGKHVFLSRTATPHSQSNSQENGEKLRRLEFQFHMSLVQEGSASGLGPDSMNSINQQLIPGTDMNPLLSGYNLPLQQNQIQNGASMSSSIGSIPNVPPNNQELNRQQTPFVQWPELPGTGIPGNTTLNNNSWQNATTQMQQSLFNVFKEAQTSSLTSLPAPSLETSKEENMNPKPNTPPLVERNKNSSTVESLSKTEIIDESLNQSTNTKTDSNAILETSHANIKQEDQQEILSGFDAFNDESSPEPSDLIQTSNGAQSKITIDPNNSLEQNWLLETMLTVPPMDSSSAAPIYSTPFTSKSFDDLHQYLGKDVNGTTQVKPGEQSIEKKNQQMFQQHTLKSDEDLSLVSSDAYALFAQQSAMAVSKHSAYSIDERGAIPRLDKIDLERQRHSQSNKRSFPVPTVRSVSATIVAENSSSVPRNSNNGVVFNETNLQLHSEAAEVLSRADQNSNRVTDPVCNTPSLGIGGSSSHVNLVSGSERSSDSAEGSSRSGSGSGSGSDNASDNSDSASDEGNGGASERKNLDNPPAKRQKLGVVNIKESGQ